MSEVKNRKRWASCYTTVLLICLVVLSAAPAAASTIYAIDSRGDRLYRLDPLTGAATLVAPTSPPIVDPRGSGLAVEWATGRVFVSNLSWQYFLGFEGWLGVLDPATGAIEPFDETLFSTTDPPRGVNGMAFARDGNLYGVAGSIPGVPWGLVPIDTGTGRAGDLVPFVGVTELGGLARARAERSSPSTAPRCTA